MKIFRLFESDEKEVARQPVGGYPHEDAAALRAVQSRSDKFTTVKDENGNTVRSILPLPRWLR